MDETTKLLEEIKSELARKVATYEPPKRYPLARRTMAGVLASGSLCHILALEYDYDTTFIPVIEKWYGRDSKLAKDANSEADLVSAFAEILSLAH